MRIAAGIRATHRAQRLSLIAAIGVGALAFTGCSAINQQSTTMVYSASDGVRLDMGPLELRNMLIVSEGADAPGRVAGTLYNTSKTDITLTISGAQGSQTDVAIKSRSHVVLNAAGEAAILDTVKAPAGAVETITLRQSGDSESAELRVPVLDGTLAEYKSLVPTATPTP
ncbi:hypothetical protein [Specibacter sp. RAF43]|uniref:hypothetical protein n=1 Tax=Specibacter sp. RAF43 TaxID=3233057 RepID=UPI003F9A8449